MSDHVYAYANALPNGVRTCWGGSTLPPSTSSGRACLASAYSADSMSSSRVKVAPAVLSKRSDASPAGCRRVVEGAEAQNTE